MNLAKVLLAALFTLMPRITLAGESRSDKSSSDEFTFTGGFTTSKREFFIGEAILAHFEAVNVGQRSARFATGSDYRATGRHDRYSFKATDPDGNPVPDPVENGGIGGGLGGAVTIEPGKRYAEDLLVNLWAAFTRPGKYTIVGSRSLEMVRKSEFVWSHPGDPTIVITSTITITLKDDPKALSAHVGELKRRLHDHPNELDFDELRALALCRIKEARPLLLEIALAKDEGKYTSRPYWATDWLKHYSKADVTDEMKRISTQAESSTSRARAVELLAAWHDPSTEQTICAQLKAQDNFLRRSAVQSSGRFKPNACFEVLLRMTNDSDPIVRRYLSYALAEYKDEKAIPAIKHLLDDPGDPFIRIWAADALGKFGHKDGVPVLIALMEKPEGAPVGNVAHVLKTLTGQDFGEHPEKWVAWWKAKQP